MKTDLRIEQIVSELKGVLGSPLTTLVAGIKNQQLINKWEKGEQIPSAESKWRLRLASQVVQILQKSEELGTIRSWFVGTDPILEGRSPAMVISEAEKGDYDLKLRVIQAAEAFLAE
ncbi:MAG: hypothetical protein Q8P08_00340 [bacterium]|nr:hypothetical protein [bacterium]